MDRRKEMGKENWINKGLNLRTRNVVFCLFGFAEVIFSFPLVLFGPSTTQPHLLHNDFLIPSFVQHHLGIHFSLLDICTIPSGDHLIQFTEIEKKEEKLQNKRCSHKTNLYEGEERFWVMNKQNKFLVQTLKLFDWIIFLVAFGGKYLERVQEKFSTVLKFALLAEIK